MPSRGWNRSATRRSVRGTGRTAPATISSASSSATSGRSPRRSSPATSWPSSSGAPGNVDARLLAILLMKLRKLSRDELDLMVRSADFVQVADWLNAYVVKNHPDKESLRRSWMDDDDPWAARAGWSLTAGRVARSPDGLDLPALLDRIESEMAEAP